MRILPLRAQKFTVKWVHWFSTRWQVPECWTGRPYKHLRPYNPQTRNFISKGSFNNDTLQQPFQDTLTKTFSTLWTTLCTKIQSKVNLSLTVQQMIIPWSHPSIGKILHIFGGKILFGVDIKPKHLVLFANCEFWLNDFQLKRLNLNFYFFMGIW